jgi:hypothetical protein
MKCVVGLALGVAACVGKPARPGEWKLVPDANEPGGLTTARLAWDPDLHAVVMYGGDGITAPSDAMWSFDGAHWQKVCDPCNVSRHRAGFAWDGSQLLVFGGENEINGDSYTNDVFAFRGGAWSAMQISGSAPDAQTFAQIVPYHDRVYAVGGYATSGPSTMVASFAAGSWRKEPDTGDTVVGPGMGVTADTDHDRILALVDSAGNFEEDGVWSFGGTRWDKLCDPCTGVVKHSASLIHVPDHDLTLILGGQLRDTSFVAGARVLVGDKFVPYDDPPSFPARAAVGVAYDPERDLVVVYGGASDDCQLGCDETWELTPE